jgi:phosphatidylglycerophosphatase A
MKKHFIIILSTLLYTGYVPIMSGTVGSFLGLLLFLALKKTAAFYISVCISFIVACFVCGPAEKIFKEKDSRKIIIDDFSGMLVTFLFIPFHLGWIVAAFFVFRIIDILKIYPINKIEKYGGALGILGDDIVGGFFAGIFLLVCRGVFHFLGVIPFHSA